MCSRILLVSQLHPQGIQAADLAAGDGRRLEAAQIEADVGAAAEERAQHDLRLGWTLRLVVLHVGRGRRRRKRLIQCRWGEQG